MGSGGKRTRLLKALPDEIALQIHLGISLVRLKQNESADGTPLSCTYKPIPEAAAVARNGIP